LLGKSEAGEEKRLAYVTFTRARELFYYIGIDGRDGWNSFINTGKDFAAKRLAVIDSDLPAPAPVSLSKELSIKAEKQYRLLKALPASEDHSAFPRVITVTQLLDMEFLENAFKKRYIEKSFPVDEALREIASSEETLNAGDSAVLEGTFLHRVFQSATKDNFEEFIGRALIQGNEALENRKEKLFDAARTFYGSPFYEKYCSGESVRRTEWEINFNFIYEEKPVLIKAVLDLYLQAPEKGIIVDYKLKYKSESERYARQLNYYAYFLNELGYPADELYIYDISGGREISVPKETGDMHKIIQKNLTGIKAVYSQLIQAQNHRFL
jgi:ATP-dependent exoDNAse (exonuclease V) beta subunit